MIGYQIQIVSLADLKYLDELPETHFTLEENAEEKAEFIFNNFKTNCFSEDTGLEIKALNNEPGVFSARYAGEQKSAADNINLVLAKMKNIQDRSARFRTVICLILSGSKYFFEGIVEGKILTHKKGVEGFGYDPVFAANGFEKSFAELLLIEKNRISHRSNAFEKMRSFLLSNC